MGIFAQIAAGQSGPAAPATTGGGFFNQLAANQAPKPGQPNIGLTPGGPTGLAAVGANLAKLPGQAYKAITSLPGAQIGNAIGTSLAGPVGAIDPLLHGNFQNALDTLKVGAQNSAQDNSFNKIGPKIIGDTVQAVALPASIAVGGPEAFSAKGVLPFLGRTAVNGGYGGALAGGNTAANGGSAKDIETNTAEGFGAGAFGSASFEGAGALKNVISGSTEPYSAALKQVTPEYESATPTQKAKFVGEHTSASPRIQEGGVLSGRTIIPNDTEKAAATEVAKIPGYSPNATNLQTHTLIQSEIGNQANALRTSLQNEKVIVPKQEIANIVTKATTDIPDESTLIQRGDAPLANYIRSAKAAVAQSPGTLEGVLDVRQSLDTAYENARGKLAYGSDKVAPLDEIHQEARNALNQYLEDHAQNTSVKAALRSQSLLFRADDVIRGKAATEGGSALDRVKTKVAEHKLVSSGVAGVAAIEGARKLLTGSF